jgi:hypothetical protein
MLDVYGTMIGDSSSATNEQIVHPMEIVTPDSLCMLIPTGDEASLTVSPENKPPASVSHGSREEVSFRELGELSKVARVVSQFTKRYWDGGEEQKSPDFFRALAHLLRSKLQSATAQATG